MRDDLARDKALDKLVEARARAGLKPGDSNCLSAETLAAYMERTLTSGERASCDSHIANCARCQEHVAALVRMSEAEEPARTAVPAPSRSARFSWFRWVYAGPVFAALLVAGIYIVGPFRTIVQQPPQSSTKFQQPVVRQTPPPQSASEDKGAVPAEKREPETSEKQMYDMETKRASNSPVTTAAQAGAGGTSAGKGASGVPATEVPTRGRNEYALTLPPKPSQAENRVAETTTPQTEPGSNERKQDVRSREIAAPSVRSDLAKTRAGEDAGTGGGATAGVIGGVSGITSPSAARKLKDDRTAGPPPQHSEATAKAAKELDGLQRSEKKAKSESTTNATTTAEIRDKDQKVPSTTESVMVTAGAATTTVQGERVTPGWRVGRHGLIEQRDANGNWVKRQSGVKSNLKAIVFPNSDVGWAVGDEGTILRSIDGGNSWSEIHSPTSDRIIRVTAINDRVATIFTRGRLAFSTADGGMTWSTPPSE